MKTCPTCKRTYADDSLSYCLIDGEVLSAPYDPNATLHLPDVRTTNGRTPAPPPQTTIVALQPPKLYSDKQQSSPAPKQTSKVVWLIGVLVILVVGLSVALFAALRSSSKTEPSTARANGSIAVASPTVSDPGESTVAASPTVEGQSGSVAVASPTVESRSGSIAMPRPTATPKTEQPERWERHLSTSINEGTRITFYAVTSQQQCQNDCERNPRCRAYTVIKAGFYNTSDPQMCYLMAAIKTLNPSPCCFSAIKR